MIYTFGDQFSFSLFSPAPRSSTPSGGATQPKPDFAFNEVSAVFQSSDASGRDKIIIPDKNHTQPIDIEEFASPGFHYLDTGMKNYFSDLRIPSKDSTRFLRVVVAGMRRGIQTWASPVKHGRVKLPVMSISRTSHAYNPEKFSPPHHHAARRYNTDRTKVKLAWRPAPWLVEYTLTLWAEHKRDAEHIIHQLLTRYNPLAEFRTDDGHSVGTITLRYGGLQDSSDKEASSEQLAKIKYELTTTAEAWLSLPEQIVPTILGTYGGIDAGDGVVPWSRFSI